MRGEIRQNNCKEQDLAKVEVSKKLRLDENRSEGHVGAKRQCQSEQQ